MSLPSPAPLKNSVDESVGFAEWFAEVWRGRSWVKKLILLDALFLLVSGLALPRMIQMLTSQPLPSWYWILCTALASLVFIIAVVIAIRTPHPGASTLPRDLSRRSAVKGLLPFELADALLFTRLQRDQIVHDCAHAIEESNFRIGVFCGESGC